MKERHAVLNTLFLILQIGITMLVTFGLCFAIGLFLDRQFGTKLLWVFIVLGILSGYRAVYLLIRHHIRGRAFEKEKPEWYDRAFSEEISDLSGEGITEGGSDEEASDPDDAHKT